MNVDKWLCAAYMENCFSLASMLRCLIHILVSADPMSLVPPERQQNTVEFSDMHQKHIHKYVTKIVPATPVYL